MTPYTRGFSTLLRCCCAFSVPVINLPEREAANDKMYQRLYPLSRRKTDSDFTSLRFIILTALKAGSFQSIVDRSRI